MSWSLCKNPNGMCSEIFQADEHIFIPGDDVPQL